MTPNPSLFHMYCIDARECFSELESETWKRTGLVRWHNLTSEMDWTQALEGAVHVYAFLWSNGPLKSDVAVRLGSLDLKKVSWVAGAPANVLSRNGNLKGLPDTIPFDKAQLVTELIERHNISRSGPTVEWNLHDRDSRLAKNRFASEGIDLDLALEKYFPGRMIRTYVRSVSGGLSGTPLLSFLLDGEYYFMKFFSPATFQDEWNAHETAKAQWLGCLAVDIVRIPFLTGTPNEASQHAIAFSGSRHAICYHRAKSTKRLDELYAESPSSAKRAYESVLDALQIGNDQLEPQPMELHILADIGPPFNGFASGTLLDALRSDAGAAPIESCLESVKRYGLALFGPKWSAIDSTIRGFLGKQLPNAIQEACPCTMGHVHGDANSRNFLFDGTRTDIPSGLQIVDCGGYKQRAPLVFDLAQLEADLKFVLMGTEQDSGYEEIAPTDLKRKWVAEEERSIDTSLRYSGPKSSSVAISRCYDIIALIRRRAQCISTNDEFGRAYLYCLLYWTLRKTRLPGRISSVKCLFVFYSAWLILKKLDQWRMA